MNRAAFPWAILTGNGEEQVHSQNIASYVNKQAVTQVDYPSWVEKRNCTLPMSADDMNLRELQLMLKWAEPLFRRNLARLQEWLADTSWSSVKINPHPCTCDQVTQFIRTRWGEQLWGKVPDDAGGEQAENESAAHLCSIRCYRADHALPRGWHWKAKRQQSQAAGKQITIGYKGNVLHWKSSAVNRLPKRLWNLYPWRCAEHSWKRPWGTWSVLSL